LYTIDENAAFPGVVVDDEVAIPSIVALLALRIIVSAFESTDWTPYISIHVIFVLVLEEAFDIRATITISAS
jgi:hypothetical protein